MSVIIFFSASKNIFFAEMMCKQLIFCVKAATLGRTWAIDWLTCHKSMKYTCVIQFKLYLPRYARSQIPTYKLCLIVIRINVFISTDRLSFPNNKISIFTGRPPISSILNSISMLCLSKLNLLQYNRKCSEHSFLYPHEQEALGRFSWTNKSTCITLLTIVNNVYFYMYAYSFLGRTWGIDWLTCHKSMKYTCVIQRKCSEHLFLYPHEQEALGTKFDLNKSLFRELHLFLSLACNTLRYRSPKEK
jgi:hypothetical protein